MLKGNEFKIVDNLLLLPLDGNSQLADICVSNVWDFGILGLPQLDQTAFDGFVQFRQFPIGGLDQSRHLRRSRLIESKSWVLWIISGKP